MSKGERVRRARTEDATAEDRETVVVTDLKKDFMDFESITKHTPASLFAMPEGLHYDPVRH